MTIFELAFPCIKCIQRPQIRRVQRGRQKDKGGGRGSRGKERRGENGRGEENREEKRREGREEEGKGG